MRINFYFDVGILNAQLDISYRTIIEDQWSISKGPVAENFVAQELFHYQKEELLSWKDHTHEIEFLCRKQNEIFPLEVKASVRSRPSKSLEQYCQRYKPKTAYKIAPRNFGKNNDFVSIPIYAVGRIFS